MRPVLITLAMVFATGCSNDVLDAPMCMCTGDACFAEDCADGLNACMRPDGSLCVNYREPCDSAVGVPSCTGSPDGVNIVEIEGAVVCVSRDAWPGEHQPCE